MTGGFGIYILRIVIVLTMVVVGTGCCTPMFTRDIPTGCGNRHVAIVVEPALIASIRTGLSQFETDLCAVGYNTIEHTTGFANPASFEHTYRDSMKRRIVISLAQS